MVEAKKYVVLDVETNGLYAHANDLLSITFFDPDTKEIFNRFLPLDLQKDVYTTDINGITKTMLKKQHHITQDEWEGVVSKFDLYKRTILTYGDIDARFLKHYFKRHKLKGFENLTFLNFKHNIISSSFSSGNITKDNLCKAFGIDGVEKIHSGVNDCVLEWQLFEKMDEKVYIVSGDDLYLMPEDYFIPVSRIYDARNYLYHIKNLPQINIKRDIVYELVIENVILPTELAQLVGISFEKLLNIMLNVHDGRNVAIIKENFSKLTYVTTLPTDKIEIEYTFNDDGTVAVKDKNDKDIELLNNTIRRMKTQLEPLVSKLKNEILKSDYILTQETVVNYEEKVMANCDLSSEYAVVEVKTTNYLDFNRYKYQLYYQSNGREVYVLQACSYDYNYIKWVLSKVTFVDGSLPKHIVSPVGAWKIVKNWKEKNPNGSVYQCSSHTGLNIATIRLYWHKTNMSFDEFFESTTAGKNCKTVLEWRKENPSGNKMQCRRDTGLGEKVVRRFWNGYADYHLQQN